MPDGMVGCPVPAKESVALRLRPVATRMEKVPDAITTDRSTRAAAGSVHGARNSYDAAAARNSERDGNRDQASGRRTDSSQGATARRERGSKLGVPHAATAQT